MGENPRKFIKCYYFQYWLEVRFRFLLYNELSVSIISNKLIISILPTINTTIKIGAQAVAPMFKSTETSTTTSATIKINSSAISLILAKIYSVVSLAMVVFSVGEVVVVVWE